MKKMKQSDIECVPVLFSDKMKLANLIESNYKLLSIFSRLGIKFGFGEQTVGSVCKQYNLSPELFLMICRIYSIDRYVPSIDKLQTDDIENIVSYLQSSHRYYSDIVIPRIKGIMTGVVVSCDEAHQKTLNRFFDDYCTEVAAHFQYEEETVFPYIDSLLSHNNVDRKDYNIDQFEENHSNIDEKLNDLKSIVMKYLPDNCRCSIDLQSEVLFAIFRLEEDLQKHTLIEDHILIPMVEKLEKDVQ